MEENKPKSKRGFASMSPERRREVAIKGGKKGTTGGFYGRSDLAREQAARSVAVRWGKREVK
ncbi:MAG: hypothetical protein NVS1B10_01350 [Candidatus Saccharimonadales bacterium]